MCDILFEKLERVRSFQILKWRYFDASLLNPYRLASCGYRCVELNTV